MSNIPELRYYQMDVADRAANRVRQGLRRGIIQGGTGAGKGHCIGYLGYRAYQKGSRVLIVADRRRLVNQLGGVLDDFGVRYGVIMSGKTGATRENVILASRDTFVRWIEEDKDIPPFDMIIPDECHLFPGATFQRIAGRYPHAVVIGATATPARNDGKSMGDYFQFLECMVPPSQLIREGYLIKPEVYAPVELAKKRRKGEGKGLAGDPVAHWRQHATDLPTIAFTSKVDESLALRDRFLSAGISAEHIDASADDAEREAKFKRLQTGQTMVLCSVKLLIQGVDIPEVSAAILYAKFGSIVEYLQACGRIMRPAPGKTRAVVLDHAGAAGVHGLPGEDVEWSLDLSSTVGDRRNQAIQEGRKEAVVFCQACGAAFESAPACPACGWTVPRQQRKRTMAEAYEGTRDEILSRFDAEMASERLRELHQAAWRKCIFTAIAKGRPAGMAAAMFAKQCKLQPWQAKVSPLPENRWDWQKPAADVWPQFVRRKA